MALDTVIQQGSFTSDGTARDIVLRPQVDWIWVYNETILNDAALAADRGAMFYFRRGMTNGRGIEYRKLGTVANDPLTTRQIAANGGIFLLDSTAQPVQARVGATAITNAVQPVVNTGDTGALTTGSVVRLEADTNLPNLMGMDFEVDNVVANTSFRLRYALAQAPGAAGAGDGFYRHILFDPIYYPRRRFIVDANAIGGITRVTMSVTHGFTVGQVVRFQVPAVFGMTQLDGLKGTITAINTAANTIDVDIDSSTFTAFAFPQPGNFPHRWAQVVPVGEDTGEALTAGADILAGAQDNEGALFARLIAGASNPAGNNNDVISWQAGRSFIVDNV